MFPEKYDPKEAEPRIQKFWEEKGIYKFDPYSKKEIYSVDTPPPTVSGKMHAGHSFSYSQQDFIVRFQRMNNKNVFYPFGTDDNGLPTERLVEKLNNVRCTSMSRNDFIKLCLTTLEKLRPDFVNDWKKLGISCDWNIFYSTINDHSRKISQRSFLELYKIGREYRKQAPTMWCPECQTAIAQVELEDKELDSTFNDIIFKAQDGKEVIIATTRPELLSSCVAVFFHPDDKRYQLLNGKELTVPLFGHKVKVLPDQRVNPDKGTGIVMCCTFGDQTDIEWYKAYNLSLKISIAKNGLMAETAGKYKGLKIKAARKEVINDLKQNNLLVNQKPIKHIVNVHERCGTEIEILETTQWFVKYLDLKNEFLELGNQLNWHPKYMKNRFDNWVKGLQWDWCISRQRYFGIPIPVWYCKKCDTEILAEEKILPIDPTTDNPPIKECPKCGGKDFIAERDVLDTWATSSLTPQIATELFKGSKVFKKLFPMSLRPQAHDIISFWLFNTVVKSYLHTKKLPWKDTAISGWLLDPHGKKMSKSKGNTIEPQELMNKYCADALRFMAGSSKLGEDMPYQEKELVAGMKNITKIFNATKLATMNLQDFDGKKPKNLTLVDKHLLSKLQQVVKESTKGFEQYDYSRTRLSFEKFFWHTYCDNYLEFIKYKLYDKEKYKEDIKSIQYTLYTTALSLIKLIAPIMPHITEEIYQSFFKKKEEKESIHLTDWPEFDKKLVDETAEQIGDLLIDLVSVVRKTKSQKQLSLKTPVKTVKIACDDKNKKLFEQIKQDFLAVTFTQNIEFVKDAELVCEINKDFKLSVEL